MATLRGYRGYVIWTRQDKRGMWRVFYRAPYSVVNNRLLQPFASEAFGLRCAEIVIDSRIGFVGPAAA